SVARRAEGDRANGGRAHHDLRPGMAGTVAAGPQCPPRRVWAGRRSRVGARGGRLGGSQMSFFGRVLTAMVTPFDEAANVDYPQAAALAKRLADSGSDGIVVAGKTGEAPTLPDEEKIRLFGTVEEAVAGRAVDWKGVG